MYEVFFVVLSVVAMAISEDVDVTESMQSSQTSSGLGSECGVMTDCLHIQGSECMNKTCKCVSPFIQKADTCILGGCNSDTNCTAVSNAICSMEGRCVCKDMHTLKGKQCVRNFLDEECNTDANCLDTNLKCKDSKCRCRDGTMQDGAQCIAVATGKCPDLSAINWLCLVVMLLYHGCLK